MKNMTKLWHVNSKNNSCKVVQRWHTELVKFVKHDKGKVLKQKYIPFYYNLQE